jgi:Na+-driven multidrug efflux pump
MLCFSRPILSALTTARAVISLGVLYLIPMALAQLPQQVCGVYSGALRGSGDTRTPMFVSALGIWLVRLPLAYLFSRFFRLGIVGVWWAMASDITVRWAVTWWRYRRVNWQRAA